jgi:hypothetical protein
VVTPSSIDLARTLGSGPSEALASEDQVSLAVLMFRPRSRMCLDYIRVSHI